MMQASLMLLLLPVALPLPPQASQLAPLQEPPPLR